jgi:23S rRNA (adenine2030-N6)-methyltransferase
MNYRHAYHAGSFADVLKHMILVEIITNLLQKEKPFFYLDTHAGQGLYDLEAPAAQKTQEANFGIKRLMAQPKIPQGLARYMQVIKSCQQTATQYPGSPLIVRQLMRSDDRMVLTELHEEEFAKLTVLFAKDRQVLVQHQDAYQALKALLPPMPRRGLVLIDPAFEVTDEFTQVIQGIKEALQRWQTGIYMIWYPLKDKMAVANFIRKLTNLGLPLLNVTLQIFPDEAEGLKHTGVAILNPPYQLAETLRKILPELWKTLAPTGEGGYKIKFLNLR